VTNDRTLGSDFHVLKCWRNGICSGWSGLCRWRNAWHAGMVVRDWRTLVDVGGLVVAAATDAFCFQAFSSWLDAYWSSSVRRV